MGTSFGGGLLRTRLRNRWNALRRCIGFGNGEGKLNSGFGGIDPPAPFRDDGREGQAFTAGAEADPYWGPAAEDSLGRWDYHTDPCWDRSGSPSSDRSDCVADYVGGRSVVFVGPRWTPLMVRSTATYKRSRTF